MVRYNSILSVSLSVPVFYRYRRTSILIGTRTEIFVQVLTMDTGGTGNLPVDHSIIL